MKMKSVVLLVMAVGCGLVAMLGVQQVLSGEKKPPVETGKVLVTLTNIMPGQRLDDTNVVFKDWPKGQIPQGAVTSREQFEERALRVAAVPNEPIMTAKLTEKGVYGTTSEIPTGMRVATVPVNVTQTHSGMIMAGDRVDVVVTYSLTIPGHAELRKTKTILQYIEVFATDNIRQSAVANGENKEVSAKNISLLVTPDQYNLLALAESKGKISLALRHRGDSAEVHPATVDDTTFDGTRISKGDDRKDKDDEGGSDSGDSAKSGVRTALDKESKKATAKGAKIVKDETEKPTWKLKIFEGEKIREEEVTLPAEATDAGEAGKSGGRWNNFFKNMLGKSKDHSA